MSPEVVITVSGACVFIFSVFCGETLSKERACDVSCQVNLRTKHRDPPPKKGACGVILPRNIRRQLT